MKREVQSERHRYSGMGKERGNVGAVDKETSQFNEPGCNARHVAILYIYIFF